MTMTTQKTTSIEEMEKALKIYKYPMHGVHHRPDHKILQIIPTLYKKNLVVINSQPTLHGVALERRTLVHVTDREQYSVQAQYSKLQTSREKTEGFYQFGLDNHRCYIKKVRFYGAKGLDSPSIAAPALAILMESFDKPDEQVCLGMVPKKLQDQLGRAFFVDNFNAGVISDFISDGKGALRAKIDFPYMRLIRPTSALEIDDGVELQTNSTYRCTNNSTLLELD